MVVGTFLVERFFRNKVYIYRCFTSCHDHDLILSFACICHCRHWSVENLTSYTSRLCPCFSARLVLACTTRHHLIAYLLHTLPNKLGDLGRRKAIDPLALKHMILAIARLSATTMASFDNDAKSCFDRIVMLLASLVAQRYGVNSKVCELFLKTLASIKYHVKTKNGVSDSYYTMTEQHTIHGPGQGGRGSPAIWAIISCLLMECMSEGATGIELIDPTLLKVIKLYTSGFVDDVTLWIGNVLRSLQQNETPTMLLEETAEAAQWWESLLYATGGKLELDKCFFYLIYWEFNGEGLPRLLQPDEYPMDMTITDSATNTRSKSPPNPV
jgi:hypothetical protein